MSWLRKGEKATENERLLRAISRRKGKLIARAQFWLELLNRNLRSDSLVTEEEVDEATRQARIVVRLLKKIRAEVERCQIEREEG